MKIIQINASSRLALVGWLIIQTLTGQHLPAQATDFQIVMDNVHVLQQRESGGGDRPYFCSVVFRSRIFQRGSTEVTIVESEPHDWVSKAKYNEGRLRRGDHMTNTRLIRNASATPINVSELILQIRTGGDDLRGGNDNLNVSVLFERDRPLTVNNVNRGARWRDNSTHTVRIRLPRPTPLSEISGLNLSTTFGGGIGGDNWNMDAIKVRAVGTGIDRVVHDRSGRPLNRFTGDRQSFRISF